MNSKYIVISDRERSRSLEKYTNPKIYINVEKSCYSYEKGDIIGGVYKFIEKIKDGTFGRVILVRDINKGNFYALKIIKDSKYDCKIEFDAAKSLFYSSCINHPGRMHIGRSHTYFQHNDTQFILMDRYGLNLYEFIQKKSFTNNQVIEIIRQMLLALDFIHQQQYYHTDIKLENIVFRTQEHEDLFIKLIDFGSVVNGKLYYKGIVNTRTYRAPEVILQLRWNEKQDIWCLGGVMYELLFREPLFEVQNITDCDHLAQIELFCGLFPKWMQLNLEQNPFNNGRVKNQRNYLQKQNQVLYNINSLSRNTKNILIKMLTIDPRSRPSAKELLKDIVFCEKYQNIITI